MSLARLAMKKFEYIRDEEDPQFFRVPRGQQHLQIDITKEGDAFPKVNVIKIAMCDHQYWDHYVTLNIDNESRGDEVQVVTGFENARGAQEFVSRTLTQIGIANNIENYQVVITSHINCNVWDLFWNHLPVSHYAVDTPEEFLHFSHKDYLPQIEEVMDLPHDHNNGMQLAGVQFVDIPLEQI